MSHRNKTSSDWYTQNYLVIHVIIAILIDALIYIVYIIFYKDHLSLSCSKTKRNVAWT